MTTLSLHALRALARSLPDSTVRTAAVRAGQKLAQRRRREAEVTLSTGDPMAVRLDEFVGYHLFIWGEFEQNGIDCVCSQLTEGDVFLDIGAHFGLYSMFAARAVGPTGRVHAFEPGPTQREYLERNAARIGGGIVAVQPIAVGAEVGTANFMQSHESNLGQSYVDTQSAGGGLSVPVTTVDAYCDANGIDKVHAIKIDVEGGEHGVIAGARRLLERSPPRIIAFECVSSLSHRGSTTPQQVFDDLRHFGYRFVAITDARIVPVQGHDPSYNEYAALSPDALRQGPLSNA